MLHCCSGQRFICNAVIRYENIFVKRTFGGLNMKGVLSIFLFLISSNLCFSQNNIIVGKSKVILSDNLKEKGYSIIDSSVQTFVDNDNNLSTYIGFTTSKKISDIVFKAFDKIGNILVDPEYTRITHSRMTKENLTYVYYTYFENIPSEFIYEIVIDSEKKSN